MAQADIESVLKEERVFEPPKEFSAKAHIKNFAEYEQLYQQAQDDPEGFWAAMAKELDWFKPWDKVLEWNPPFAKWFVGGKINVCLQLPRPPSDDTLRKNKAAIIWEGEPGDARALTYQMLHREVCKFANVLKALGVKNGRPRRHLHAAWCRSWPIAMLACARIGATHSVVFGGFSAEAVARPHQRCQGQGGHHRRRRLRRGARSFR